MDLNIKGRRVLVTGAGQGVGRRIAHVMAAEGAQVVVNDLLADRADRVAEEVSASGGRAIGCAANITSRDDVSAMLDKARSTLGGPIDILVNNAGVIPERRSGEVGLALFHESDPASWRKMIDLNVLGAMNCIHAVLPGMIENRWGRIVSVMSDAGIVGEPRMVAYSAAKSALSGMTKAIAKEVGRHAVTANIISLAAVTHEDPMSEFLNENATAENNETLAKVLRQYPAGRGLGRLTRPEDAAHAIAFLASDKAEYITGQTLPVNGGYSMP